MEVQEEYSDRKTASFVGFGREGRLGVVLKSSLRAGSFGSDGLGRLIYIPKIPVRN